MSNRPSRGRIWRGTCCVLPNEDIGRVRSMRNLILALATLVGVVMMAANATHTF